MICSQRISILRLKWIAITSFIIVRAICPAISAMKVLLVQGSVEIVSEEEKEKALTLLMNHYHPESVKFNPKFVHMTQCMKIIVNDMTAKRAMPKKDTPDYKVMQFQGEVRSPHM